MVQIKKVFPSVTSLVSELLSYYGFIFLHLSEDCAIDTILLAALFLKAWLTLYDCHWKPTDCCPHSLQFLQQHPGLLPC